MRLRNEVLDFCDLLTRENDSWHHYKGVFICDGGKSCRKVIDPLWSFKIDSVSVSPIVAIQHEEIQRLHRKIFDKEISWISHLRIKNYYDGYSARSLRFYDFDDCAEALVQKIFRDGNDLLDEQYFSESETELLEGIPPALEGADGVKYCLVKAYIGDLTFVENYRSGNVVTKRPKKFNDIDKILDYFG